MINYSLNFNRRSSLLPQVPSLNRVPKPLQAVSQTLLPTSNHNLSNSLQDDRLEILLSSRFLLVHLQRLGLPPDLGNDHGSGEKLPTLLKLRLNPNNR
jgi:hypothetical protein